MRSALFVSGLALGTSALAAPPETIDKSGLDVLCSSLGGTYFKGSQYSVCEFPDGTWMSCDMNTGECSSTRNVNPNAGAVNNLLILKALSVITSQLSGLAATRAPDLVPLLPAATTAPEGFCNRDPQSGGLMLHVANQGTAAAAASTTLVRFNCSEAQCAVGVNTPALNAGSGASLGPVAIPNSCFDSSLACKFTIGVDAANLVTESNEVNNNAAGMCTPQLQ